MPFQWSLFIGPAWEPADSPYFVPWSSYAIGVASNLDFQTTLTSGLNSGATSLFLTSAASFPSLGGVWVGPNNPGEAWEYMPYAGKSGNVLTGLVREPTGIREHSGVHTAGAVARMWMKIASNDGKLNFNDSLDEMLVANDWSFEVGGIAAPQVAFKPFHLAVLQSRTAVSGSLVNTFVGFLDSSTIRDDKRRVRAWSVRIGSSALLLNRIEVQGVRVGTYDLAEHGSAVSSIPLGAAHKERNVGDFVAANPSFDPNNVLDEDNDSMWIGDRIIGQNENPSGYDGFTQFYINPPITINSGTRWLEIIGRDTASVDIAVWDADLNAEFVLDIASQTLSDSDRYIVAENMMRFTQENPSQEAFHIFDVSGSDNPNWFGHVRAHGGAIAFRMMGANYSGAIYWGTVTPATTGWAPDGFTGPSLPAPAYDQTMRYLYNSAPATNTRDRWEVSRRQSPGYTIQDNNEGEQAWLAVNLPSMGLVLHENVTPTVPGVGATLLIDGQGTPSTDGLPNSGTLVVGDERISYSAKVSGGVTVSGRGVGGTSAANHVAGDAVLLVFSQGGRETITDALPLKELRFERWGGTVYPSTFRWRYSALEARTPDQSQHTDDYEVTNAYSGQTGATHSQALANNRAKTVLLEIRRMTVNAARPRLNRLKVVVDPAYFDGSRWLPAGQTIEQLIKQIGMNAGLSAAAIVANAGGNAPSGFTTAIDKAFAVMTSAAELGGSRILVRRDSIVTASPDSFWTQIVGNLEPAWTWTRSNASSIEFVRTGGGMVSQVKLHWRTPDNSNSGTVVYPAQPAKLGSVSEVGPLYFASEEGAQAAAQRRYILTRYPYEIMVTLAAGDLNIAARQLHRVQWPLASDMQPINRVILVRQVQHSVQDGILGTVLQGIQVDRENDG